MRSHLYELSADAINRLWLLRLGLVVAVCAVLASAMPSGLVLPSLSTMLTIGALASALFAGFTREPVWADHLTRWDQGCVLLALSMIAGFAADPEAAHEALRQMEAARAAAAGS